MSRINLTQFIKSMLRNNLIQFTRSMSQINMTISTRFMSRIYLTLCRRSMSRINLKLCTRSMSSRDPGSPWPWTSKVFNMTVSPDKQVQVEYGECQDLGLDTQSPTILAIHPSGSTYRQFSQLPSFLPSNSGSKIIGLNLWGSGESDPWPGDLRVQTIADQAAFVVEATQAAMADQTKLVATAGDQRWHLIGHSFGGLVAVSAVGMDKEFSEKVSALTLFEPNPFYLLSAGNGDERNVLDEYSKRFHSVFYKCWATSDLTEDEIIEYVNKDLYQFWFGDDWDSLTPEQRPKMFPKGITSTHRNEVLSIKDSLAKGPRLVPGILENLARVDRKRLIVSRNPGPGASNLLRALGTLLEREAGFEVIEAPVRGHLAPITHKEYIFPLFFK